MSRVLAFVRANPARVYAVAVAVVALLIAYGVNVPDEWLGLIAVVLALAGGEAVQRVENRKTDTALEGRHE